MRGSLNRKDIYEFGEKFSQMLVNLHNEIAASDYEIEHWMENFKKNYDALVIRVVELENALEKK